MRISDWSSDVCSSDLTKRVNVCARAQSGCLRSFVAAIAKIPDLMPLPPGFCFITGFGPATRTLEKIAGALGQPIKVVALVHNHHGPATIDGMVGAEPELAARLQLRSEENTSELQSLMRTSYAVFSLKKKKKKVHNKM